MLAAALWPAASMAIIRAQIGTVAAADPRPIVAEFKSVPYQFDLQRRIVLHPKADEGPGVVVVHDLNREDGKAQAMGAVNRLHIVRDVDPQDTGCHQRHQDEQHPSASLHALRWSPSSHSPEAVHRRSTPSTTSTSSHHLRSGSGFP